MHSPSESSGRRSSSRLGQRAGSWSVALATVLVVGYLLRAPQAAADDLALAQERLRPSGIEGALVICGGGKLPEAIRQRFLELAGGEKAHVVFIPTASESADREAAEKLLAPWKATQAASVAVLHTRSRQTANDPQLFLRGCQGMAIPDMIPWHNGLLTLSCLQR